RVLQEERPEYIAVAFDAGRHTFRHQAFEEYKAQRPAMPDEMRFQMKRIRELVEALGMPIFEVEGYEADDLIGALAGLAAQRGLETLVLTGDHDTLQLVSSQVKVLTTAGHAQKFSEAKIYDVEAVRQKFGFDPGLLADYKALVGEVTDNIPGVKGIGEKTAKQLIQSYGPLEEIYGHLGQIQPRVRKLLEEQRERAFLSKRLATIVTDVPLELDLERCRVVAYDREQAVQIFRELEFRSLLERLPEPEAPRIEQMAMFMAPGSKATGEQQSWEVISTRQALDRLTAQLERASHLTLDVEASSIQSMSAELVGLALTDAPGHGWYIPLGHSLGSGDAQLGLEEGLESLRPLLESERLPKRAHNAIYDLVVLAVHGVRVRGLDFDTMIAAYLLDPGGRGFGLKDLAWHKLGVEMSEIQALIGKGKNQISMAQVPIAQVAPYAVADVEATERLVPLLESELKDEGLWDLFSRLEMPLVEVLLEMERAGVAVDVGYLKGLSRDVHLRLRELEEEIQDQAGHPFNVSSTQQLGTVLFKELRLPTRKRTKTGYSTDAEVLEGLRGTHPIIEPILEYRELSKLKSTYIDTLPLLVNRRTGRLHTSYNQTGTVTGRISTTDPNLQNIPVRSELGRKVRRAFIAAPDHRLVAADYSQVELRILAHISGDPELLAAFQRGEDIHNSTAAAILGVSIDKVTPEMRRIAKTINFGLIYGMGDYGLAQRTGLSQPQAAEFIRNYFARYPKVRE
ncbi:MAG: DNA polymerase I, partial [Chloroflexi bacterium]|nr:DNA polymerase I [Chloroflexota bacterium]